MSKPTTFASGQLLLLSNTDRWSSAIRDRVDRASISLRTFEHPDALAGVLNLYPNSVIAAELTPTLDAKALARAWQFSRQQGTPWIALSSDPTSKTRLPLIQVGFAEAFGCTSEVDRLLQRVRRFLQHPQTPSLSIEQQVTRDLPWSPIVR